MKNRLVFDDRKLHYPSKRIFITGYERNERVYRFINSSIGSIEVWKTLTDVLDTDLILDNMYIENLLSNDKTIVNIAMDCILDDAKDFIDEYLKKFK